MANRFAKQMKKLGQSGIVKHLQSYDGKNYKRKYYFARNIGVLIQEELLKNTLWTIHKKIIDNYSFTNSANNKMIQVRDAAVVLIAKLLKYTGK